MKYSAINSVARFVSAVKSRRLFSSPGKLITMFGLLLSLAVLTVYIKYPQMLSGRAIEVKDHAELKMALAAAGRGLVILA